MLPYGPYVDLERCTEVTAANGAEKFYTLQQVEDRAWIQWMTTNNMKMQKSKIRSFLHSGEATFKGLFQAICEVLLYKCSWTQTPSQKCDEHSDWSRSSVLAMPFLWDSLERIRSESIREAAFQNLCKCTYEALALSNDLSPILPNYFGCLRDPQWSYVVPCFSFFFKMP